MKVAVAVFALCVSLCVSAQAQGQVKMWGWLDSGVSYVSNIQGSSSSKFEDGVSLPNVIVLAGTEDLGKGVHAEFSMLKQFYLGSGTIIARPGGYFSESRIGLRNDRYGTLSFGQQFDFMSQVFSKTGIDAAAWGSGFHGFRNGPFNGLGIPFNPTGAMSWDRANGLAIDNSVKYVSPSVDGLTAGVMYGFGSKFGRPTADNAISASLLYAHANVTAGAVYTTQRYLDPVGGNASVRITNAGLGGRYDFGTVSVNGLSTFAKNERSGAAVYMVQVGAVWMPTLAWQLSGTYVYMKGNRYLQRNHAHQINAVLGYHLSKRTMLYAGVAFQKTNRDAQAQINYVFSPSSTSSQLITRVGVRTTF